MNDSAWYEIALILTPIFLLIGLICGLEIIYLFNLDGHIIMPVVGFGLMGLFGVIPLLIYSYKFDEVKNEDRN